MLNARTVNSINLAWQDEHRKRRYVAPVSGFIVSLTEVDEIGPSPGFTDSRGCHLFALAGGESRVFFLSSLVTQHPVLFHFWQYGLASRALHWELGKQASE